MSAYPEGFWDWPGANRNAFFKAEADALEAEERRESCDKAAKATAGNGAIMGQPLLK